MPTMPKEKSSPISITENKDSEINKIVKKSDNQQKDNKIVTMKVATTPQTPNNTYTNGIGSKRTANDFRFGKSIGEGSFSTVYLAKDIHTSKEYASKSHILTILFNVHHISIFWWMNEWVNSFINFNGYPTHIILGI